MIFFLHYFRTTRSNRTFKHSSSVCLNFKFSLLILIYIFGPVSGHAKDEIIVIVFNHIFSITQRQFNGTENLIKDNKF